MEAQPTPEEHPKTRNEFELEKLVDIKNSLTTCSNQQIELVLELTETIADLEGQVDLFNFSHDNERLLTAQAALNAIYQCKCACLEALLIAERKQNKLFWGQIINPNN